MPATNEPRSPRRTEPGPAPARAETAPVVPAPAVPVIERLQRTLARAGYGSRRGAEQLIAEGRVEVDGRIAELGDRVDPARAWITVDGVPVPSNPDLRYLAFNKPAGVTSTLADRHAARSLAELMPPGPRVFPVGRLDRDSEGLLLLTNDGELANRLAHPRFGVEKEYLVEVEGDLSRAAAAQLRKGVELDDGPARALRVGPIQRVAGRSAVSIVMGEGRKREVRRMLRAVGYSVRRLVRVRQGPVRLGDLAPGRIRTLSGNEVGDLYTAVGLDRASLGKPQLEADLRSRSRVRRTRRSDKFHVKP